MPNVAPRGLFARLGSTWRPPVQVWARVDQVWKPVEYVWAYRNGAWQLIWGAGPASPATATATWVAPATVRIDWTPPVTNTNTQWIVRRSDGSIVGTVPVGTLTITDTRPLLASSTASDSVLAAYTVEGSDGATSSAKLATNTVTWNLAPATVSTAVTYPTSTTATVTVSWTPNATYGAPQGWRVWRSDGTWLSEVLPGTTTSLVVTGQTRGTLINVRAVPYSQNPDGTWVQAGNATNTPASIKAINPASVALTATTSPISNLRLTWAAPAGSRTGYDIEHSTNGTSWTAEGDAASSTTQRDWGTTTSTGYMRIRTKSDGGESDWVQVGPKAAINDTTGPAASTITSFKPESSYGRMVVRGKWSTTADAAEGQIFYRIGSGSYVSSWGRSNITPGAAFTEVLTTASAGQTVTVLIRTWDEVGNMGTDRTDTYTLVASPGFIDPSGDKSGTFRNGEWRNDATRAINEIATGWTSGGHNIGCYFYGTQFATLADLTIVTAWIEYWRENEGGIGGGVQPLFWTHDRTSRSGTPSLSAQGVSESSRLGPAVARTGTTGTSYTLPAVFMNALKAGSARGIAMYRGYQGSGDPDNYYALLSIGGVVGGAPIPITNGRVRFTHLG